MTDINDVFELPDGNYVMLKKTEYEKICELSKEIQENVDNIATAYNRLNLYAKIVTFTTLLFFIMSVYLADIIIVRQ